MFILQEPTINDGEEIERLSLETIEKEARGYEKFLEFDESQREVIKRQIHATTNFEQVISNIWFSPNAIDKIKELLSIGAVIVVDTNMIKSGLSTHYTQKYGNQIICYVNDADVAISAKEQGVTRSYIAIKKAIEEDLERPLILSCGNAPTFLYSAIRTLIESGRKLDNIAMLGFPVGFVNVVESKEYTKEFLEHFDAQGIIMQGRFGGSTLVVSALHAIYRMIK